MILIEAHGVAMEAQPKPDPYLRLPEVERLTSLRKSTLYVLMRKGEFPPSVQLSTRCVAWRESQVLRFMDEREAASAARPKQHLLAVDRPGDRP